MKSSSASLFLLLIAASTTIDTAQAITRRLGSNDHSLGSSLLSSSPLSSSRSISALGLQLSVTATIARTQQERRQRQRRYSPATSLSTSSNKSTATTTTTSTPAEQVRGGEEGVIKKHLGEGVCVDNERNIYSSSPASSSAALSMKIRGGGVCVDNEGNFYSPRSAVAAAPQQRSQPLSSSAADTSSHQRTILASSKSSSASRSSSSFSSLSKTVVPASSSGSNHGQLGLGLGRRRHTSFSLSPSFRSPPPIRGGGGGGGRKNNINMNNMIQHRIGDLCVDKEGHLYSSLTSLRGGGGDPNSPAFNFGRKIGWVIGTGIRYIIICGVVVFLVATVVACVSTTKGTSMHPPDLTNEHDHRNTRPIIEKDL